jgi:hypothetical protein
MKIVIYMNPNNAQLSSIEGTELNSLKDQIKKYEDKLL